MTKIKEAVHKLIGYRRFIEKMAMTIPGYIFDAEPFDMAIAALEFRERYDNFWEEVKAAGMKGEETEIHYGGRVFRIREVAQ